MADLFKRLSDLTRFDRRSGDRGEPNGGPHPSASSGSEGPTATGTLAIEPIFVDTDPFEAAEPDPEAGLHAITKATNHWFERRAGALEHRAGVEAEVWARAGLPLQDVDRSEPLDVEVVLASHARQIYRDWAERVRTKLRDSISRGTRAVGERVGELRGQVARLDEIEEDLKSREEKIERIRSESARDVAPVQYQRIVPGAIFWPMAVLLVMVEFAANFPVFRLLLPLESSLTKAAQAAAENVDDTSWLAGVDLFFRSLAMHVEATVVALVVVVGLVLLGKQLGASMRPLFALTEKEHPLAATTIRAHRRQDWAVVGMTVIGLTLVLTFLFSARGSIAGTATARVAEDSTKIAARQARLSQAKAEGDRGTIVELTTELGLLLDAQQVHQDDAAYARTIQGNNRAIAFLNAALVLVAATLGFGYTKDNLSDRRGEHPDLVTLREKCAELRRERITRVAEAQSALTRASAAEGAVRHLAHSDPLGSWESKAKRLNAVVPRFRAENARLRGIDPATVRAFDVPCPLELPAVNSTEGFPIPSEMTRFIDQRDQLALRLAEHRVHTNGTEHLVAGDHV